MANPTEQAAEILHSALGAYGKDKDADIVVAALYRLVMYDDTSFRELAVRIANAVSNEETDPDTSIS